jgi:L-glyceraldehyde 3-phosphate reductase
VRQGKASYVGVSSYSAEHTREAAAIARRLGTPLIIHQPSYSLLNRWIEGGLTDALSETSMGAIAFTALAQGLLTNKYLDGASGVQRATPRPSFNSAELTEKTLSRVRGLSEIAKSRGQTLAQMALVWVLRDPRVASTLVGTSSVEQLAENLEALKHPDFTAEELKNIDRYAVESGIDLWRSSSDL